MYLCLSQSLSHVRLFATPWSVAHQAHLSIDSPGMNSGVDSPSLLQRIFLTQGLNPGLHYRWILYHLSHKKAPYICMCAYTYVYVCVCVYIYRQRASSTYSAYSKC